MNEANVLKEILNYSADGWDFLFFEGQVRVLDNLDYKPLYTGDNILHAFLAIEGFKQTHQKGLCDD